MFICRASSERIESLTFSRNSSKIFSPSYFEAHSNQERPEILPLLSMCMPSDAGTEGNPGILIMTPRMELQTCTSGKFEF